METSTLEGKPIPKPRSWTLLGPARGRPQGPSVWAPEVCWLFSGEEGGKGIQIKPQSPINLHVCTDTLGALYIGIGLTKVSHTDRVAHIFKIKP